MDRGESSVASRLPDDPLRRRFERLTRREGRAGPPGRGRVDRAAGRACRSGGTPRGHRLVASQAGIGRRDPGPMTPRDEDDRSPRARPTPARCRRSRPEARRGRIATSGRPSPARRPRRGRLVAGQAGEVAQLDQLGVVGLDLGQPVEGFIQGGKIRIGHRQLRSRAPRPARRPASLRRSPGPPGRTRIRRIAVAATRRKWLRSRHSTDASASRSQAS